MFWGSTLVAVEPKVRHGCCRSSTPSNLRSGMAGDHTTQSFEGRKLFFGVSPMFIAVVAAHVWRTELRWRLEGSGQSKTHVKGLKWRVGVSTVVAAAGWSRGPDMAAAGLQNLLR